MGSVTPEVIAPPPETGVKRVRSVVDKLTNGVDAHSSQERSEEFIREAVDKAGINALRLNLYQLTGDPELATMKVSKHPIRGGALFDYGITKEDEAIVKEKAVKFLLKGDKTVPPPPSLSESHKLMNLYGGKMLEEHDILPGYEELAFEDFPRGVEFSQPQPAEKLAQYKVVVIGAGLSGIATAIQ